MELYVFGTDRSLLGVIEAYEHLQWTRRYSACGSFTLRAIADANNLTLLRMGHFLWKNDDAEAGIIDHIELNAQEQEYITISGRFATGLLARRIIWQTELLQGSISTAIAQLLANHVIAPSDPDRTIQGVAFASSPLSQIVTTQVSYRNLLTTVEDLCAACDVGLRTSFDPITRLLTVMLYEGRETSAVFSREFENLTEQAYTHSARDYACVALVGGEGEGELRTMVTSGSAIGLGRYEVFVDAKSLRSEDFGEGYAAALIQHGDVRLKELGMARSFDATLHNQGNLRYRADFDLGDFVTVVSPRWGISMRTRIAEIEETYGADGRHIDIVLGRGALTLAQKLKGV